MYSIILIIAHPYSSKTPGGRLVYLYTKKRGTTPKCGDCGDKLNGVSCLYIFCTHLSMTPPYTQLPAVRPIKLSKLSKPKKTVNRAYGGARCHKCLRQRSATLFPPNYYCDSLPTVHRIIRAFLIEEQKIVVRALKVAQGRK